MPQATVRSSPSRIRARTSSSEQRSSAEISRTVSGAGQSTLEPYVGTLRGSFRNTAQATLLPPASGGSSPNQSGERDDQQHAKKPDEDVAGKREVCT
jgi:hypothetical protein